MWPFSFCQYQTTKSSTIISTKLYSTSHSSSSSQLLGSTLSLVLLWTHSLSSEITRWGLMEFYWSERCNIMLTKHNMIPFVRFIFLYPAARYGTPMRIQRNKILFAMLYLLAICNTSCPDILTEVDVATLWFFTSCLIFSICYLPDSGKLTVTCTVHVSSVVETVMTLRNKEG